VSPWIPEGTVVDRVFDHASIPATVTQQFIGAFANRSPREAAADTFLDLLSLPAPREDYVAFGDDAMIPAPADAADPQRAPSFLIQQHAQALREADQSFPAEHQTPFSDADLKSEQSASQYVGAVMSKLHPQVKGAGN
jgi:hypothetical protein